MAALDDLTAPLITPNPDEIILTIDSTNPPDTTTTTTTTSSTSPQPSEHLPNPFEFIRAEPFSVPPPTPLNPFRNHTPHIESLYEWVKILICIPIALVRLLVFVLSLALGFLVTKLALYGWKDVHNPLPRWRCRLLWITRMCARCILFSFGYHWIRRRGRPAKREFAPIVVSNHVSYIEPIFFFYELFPTIVASESHDTIPLVGTIIRSMQVIYVNRFSPTSRQQAVSEIKRKASSDAFPRLLLFPEGTTTNGRVLISFQLGAFVPGYPIQPVVVRYPHIHFDQSWGYISLARLMFRMFTQFHNFMEIEYLPVISPLKKKKETTVQFAERTSYAIANALNVVQTSHSYGDLMLLTKAAEVKQAKASNFMVEMARVESLLNISTSKALELLDTFLSMNPDPCGRVWICDFLKVLKLPECPLTEEIFEFLDLERHGSVTFKQFLFGSAHIMKQPLFYRACELVFRECDLKGSGYISKQELYDYLIPAISDMSDEEMQDLFTSFDTNGDGKISKDEFLTRLRKNPLMIAIFSPCLVQRDLLEADDECLEVSVV